MNRNVQGVKLHCDAIVFFLSNEEAFTHFDK